MGAILSLKGLSTEALVGKILILVGLLLKIVGVIAIFGGIIPISTINISVGLEPFKWVLTGALTAAGLLAIAGIILLFKGLTKFKTDDYQGVAVYSLVAAFFPPVGAPELIGAILLLISPECKGMPKSFAPKQKKK
jgi:hypothetical protein